MAWKKVVPHNSGGGRRKTEPTARLYGSGQFTFSHATIEMLGEPAKVIVEVDTESCRFRIKPSTPNDKGAFSLAGGGNTQARISCRTLAQARPELVGEYAAKRIAGGIELEKIE